MLFPESTPSRRNCLLNAAALSPDGGTVAVAPVSDSAHDVTGVWDVSSGKRTLSFRGPRPDG